ncbi:MAG: hypothetical protein KatS3mg109_0442 [Pirellulaceae bacterium]|nr:MAG: hypothetical protein KatS3mg109_0442 [Pirellulaceae bacterium]
MDEVVRQVLENERRLKIGRRIGRGGFAEVYEARTAEGVPCAVKVSLDPIDGDSRAVKKELETLRLVQTVTGHPNIVTLMDVWLVGGYLVTRWELATDGSLLDLLGRYQSEGHDGIPVRQLLRYMEDAAEGIDFLNGQGIYHRDIKPGNLLLFHGHVKLADLGLAKFAGVSTVSHTGSGTLGYLPPEAYDHRLCKTVDLYALAASYVKLRTGREPFGENATEIVHRQSTGDPIVDGLQPIEKELIRQALAGNPEDRPQEGAVAWVRGICRALTTRNRLPGHDAARGPQLAVPKVSADIQGSSEVAPAKETANHGSSSDREVFAETQSRKNSPASPAPQTATAPTLGSALVQWWRRLTPRGRLAAVLAALILFVLLVVPWGRAILPSRDREPKPPGVVESNSIHEDPVAAAQRAAPTPPALVETNSIGMKLVLIPAGEFMMGSPEWDTDAYPDEKPQHRVRIYRPFYLAVTEVTQEQYQQVMGTNPSYFQGAPKRPVENVSWNDAVEFCRRLSQKEGKEYRLPTEAEWEYACRAGSTTRWSFGNDASELGEYAWYGGNSGGTTHPVGQKKPNAWGLYDMHGNVWEWCADWYDEVYYRTSPLDDPKGPDSGRFRVLRGGSWVYHRPGTFRCAFRYNGRPDLRYDAGGFRVARTLTP